MERSSKLAWYPFLLSPEEQAQIDLRLVNL